MKKSAFLAFTGKFFSLFYIVGAILFMVVGYLANIYMGSAGIVLIAAFPAVIIVFIDYFAFSCASSRRQASMNFIKSSYWGLDFFKSALKTDIIIKEIVMMLPFLGYILADFIAFEENYIFADLVAILIFAPMIQVVSMLTLIISRRIALSMVAQMAVCYIASMIHAILSIVVSFALPTEQEGFPFYALVIFFVLEAIGILLAIFLYKDCVKGYESSFADK